MGMTSDLTESQVAIIESLFVNGIKQGEILLNLKFASLLSPNAYEI